MEDFVNWKLTGKAATDYSVASCTMLFDIRKKEWSSKILETIGTDESVLPEVYPSGTVIGEVQRSASEDTGLAPGTLVATGGMDQCCGALAVSVVKEGLALDSTGTVECVGTTMQTPRTDIKAMSTGQYCTCHVVENMYFSLMWLQTSGTILKWFRDNFSEKEVESAGGRGLDVYGLLMENAAASNLGASGLFMLPHFGESGSGQPPVFNPVSRGAFIGLRLTHKKEDLIRAMLEGISFETRLFIETFERSGFKVKELRAVGGGAKSPFWPQLKANIFNRRVALPGLTEVPVLGAALLAGVSDGTLRDAAQATDRAYRERYAYIPNPVEAKRYEALYRVYKKIYPTLCSLFMEIAKLELYK